MYLAYDTDVTGSKWTTKAISIGAPAMVDTILTSNNLPNKDEYTFAAVQGKSTERTHYHNPYMGGTVVGSPGSLAQSDEGVITVKRITREGQNIISYKREEGTGLGTYFITDYIDESSETDSLSRLIWY
jgi:hypothetical protein